MNQIKSKIRKLIETGEKFQWENYSNRDVIKEAFGGVPGLEWNAWVKRISTLLTNTVKKDSEAYLFFKRAPTDLVGFKGNYRKKFETAKKNYLDSLTAVMTLIDEGDTFDDLLISEFELSGQGQVPEEKTKNEIVLQGNKNVFIVHGHDHTLKVELEVFLSHIGLKPIVLHREVDSGRTVIEKFEDHSDVSYAFILLTPDEISYTIDQEEVKDDLRKKEARTRPNVTFEFGYFVAKLGRQRVCALHKGDVSIPSDLNGLIYKKVDQSIEEIGFALIKELRAAGLKPEM